MVSTTQPSLTSWLNGGDNGGECRASSKETEKDFRGGSEGECRANTGATEATDELLLDMSARRARVRLEQDYWSLL